MIFDSYQATPIPAVMERIKPAPPVHLVDCFVELIAYTEYWLAGLDACQPAFDEVRNVYLRLIDRAENKRKEAGFSDQDWQSGLFAVCAWIDESLLCSKWNERRKWESAKLQRIYFNTGNAGEEFFERLEQLPEESGAVREVYEFCLALEFKGRYFMPGDDDTLRQIRQSNLKRISGYSESDFPSALFPGAYISEPAAKKQWPFGVDWRQILIFSIPALLFVVLFFTYGHFLDVMILK